MRPHPRSSFSHLSSNSSDAPAPHFPRDISATYRANSTFRPLRPMERLTIYSMWHNNAYHWDMISGDERVFSSKVDTDLKFEFSRHGLESRNLASICDLRLVIQYRHKDSTGQLLASSLASLLNILGKTLTPGKVRLVYDFRHEGWTVQKVHEYLEPLIQLPGLASVAIVQDKFCSFEPEEVEAICTLYEDFGSRLVHQSKSHPLQPFPFLRLPLELQNTILAQTDVVSFAYHAVSALSAGNDRPKAISCCGQCDQDDQSWRCYCKSNLCSTAGIFKHPIRYSSTCVCHPWKSAVLAVSKHVRTRSLDLYYRKTTHVFWGSAFNLTKQFERIPVSARQKFRKVEICLSSTRTAYVRSLPPDVASSEFGRQLSQKPNLLYPFLTWIREHLLVSKLRIQIYLVRNMWFLEGDVIELRDNVKKEGLEGCTEVVDIDEYELISIHWQ